MSKSIYFEKVGKIPKEHLENIPGIIDLDKRSLEPYKYIRADVASDWEKEIGTLRKIQYSTIDYFNVAENLFGKRPVSMHTEHGFYLFDNPMACAVFAFEDGTTERVSKGKLKEYEYIKTEKVLIYESEPVGEIENAYSTDVDGYTDCFVTKTELLEILEKYYKSKDGHVDKDYTYECEPVVVIMQLYFSMTDDDKIIIQTD